MSSILSISPYTSLIGFVLGFPTAVGAYYQSWKTRQESRQARQGLIFSENCLEFVLDDGASINVVPLETLHSLPKPGDILLLPGGAGSAGDSAALSHGAYRVNRIEHIYAPISGPRAHAGQARLAKAVAHVDRLLAPLEERRHGVYESEERAGESSVRDDSRGIHVGRPASFYTPAMSDAPFSYQVEPGEKEGTQILALTGPLTLHSMFSFQNEFRAIRPAALIVDMTECPYIDSAGLGLLMNQYVSAENGHRKFLVVGVNTRVEAIMSATRVNTVLSLFPTVQAAEASL